MTIRFLLSLTAATLVFTTFTGVEARPPQRETSKAKIKLSSSKPKQPKWKVFTPPDKRFSVLMPGTPEKATQVQKTYMGEIELHTFIAQPPDQEVAYVVTYNDFPYSYGQMATSQKILNHAQYLALKTTQSRLVSEREIRSSNGHPGKELEYINPGGKITKHRMYFAHGRLYQVMVMTTKKQQKTLSQTMDGYLNSFHVIVQP
ncbi:MAG: hypothetical protein QNJ47_09925 [Nostocaceae cyanobacterium]|nr:hypothetical protein [Nostocaceae cyanobacterium]